MSITLPALNEWEFRRLFEARAMIQTDPIRRQRSRPLLARLRAGDHREIPAADLAVACLIGGTHENQRRRVREVVEWCRREGYRVCANGQGYWLARDAEEWARYREHVKSGAKGSFARVRDNQAAVVDRCSGQGKLFETRPIAY